MILRSAAIPLTFRPWRCSPSSTLDRRVETDHLDRWRRCLGWGEASGDRGRGVKELPSKGGEGVRSRVGYTLAPTPSFGGVLRGGHWGGSFGFGPGTARCVPARGDLRRYLLKCFSCSCLGASFGGGRGASVVRSAERFSTSRLRWGKFADRDPSAPDFPSAAPSLATRVRLDSPPVAPEPAGELTRSRSHN